ncbi:MAG: NAD(P)/FAD-dependent oxidoreductase [Bacteroidetes bacterium]|nr:NAD(P)/FAD-dependent oxidoreductase [Bacteroidota bacterium]
MMWNNTYDIIVVGAGPAGSTAARYAAAEGASVLVLEKDRDVGYPVRCGEAVSHEGLIQFIDPDPRWIATTVTRFRLVAPNGCAVEPKLDGRGYILERRLFDYVLAQRAVQEGAHVVTKAYVYDLLRSSDGTVCGVKVVVKERTYEIRAKIVIAADGVESRVGRWAGISTNCSIKDMESCAQVTITGITVEPDRLDFYFGSTVAPDGYLWVFPKGNHTANVGIGISVEAAKRRSALQYLQQFLETHFPHASILTQIAGGVPCAKTNSVLVKNNVMLVGDAAHQVNPISGGGIISGMIGGMIAGQVAGRAIQQQNFALLDEYPALWHKRLGWRHELFYSIKEVISNFTDDTLNSIAESVLKLPEDKRTLGGIFRVALWNKPSLLLDLAKLFVS